MVAYAPGSLKRQHIANAVHVDVDCVVLGAGVVGLATARALALAGCEVLLVEAEGGIGTGISARNSEVIHAGMYYPTASLKAHLCVAGKALLYQYCADRNIACRRTGKLIVATDAHEVPALQRIAQQAHANGIDDLSYLDGSQAQALEPNLRCHAALHSPSTGIVDVHGLMLALQGDAENAGAQCVFHTRFVSGTIRPDGSFNLCFAGADGAEGTRLRCRRLVNATGLSATALARHLRGYPTQHIPPSYYCKGSYFTLSGATPFARLIYPVPDDHAGLGVHLTVDLGGQTKFGPDTEWIDTPDYTVDPARADAFYAAVRRYWPGLPDGALVPAYAGVRPKISAPNAPAADFGIASPAQHGVANLVHLFGIESPGLTASLAIAQVVAQHLR